MTIDDGEEITDDYCALGLDRSSRSRLENYTTINQNSNHLRRSLRPSPTSHRLAYSQYGVQAQATVSSSGYSPLVSYRIKLKRNRELDPVRMLVLKLFIELTKYSFHQTRRQAQVDLELKTERNAVPEPQLNNSINTNHCIGVQFRSIYLVVVG